MDPGTILAIVGPSLQVSGLMYKTAEGIGSAGEDVRLKAIEIDSFTKAAKAVQQVLEVPENTPSPSRLRTRIEDVITDIIDNCKKALDPLKKLLGIFEPLLVRFAEQPRKLRSLGYMVSFSFRRNDVQKYCQALQASSGSLNLSLSALIALQTRDANVLKLQAVQVQYLIGTLEPVVNAKQDQLQLGGVSHSSVGSLQSMDDAHGEVVIGEESDENTRNTQEEENQQSSNSEAEKNQLTVVSRVSGDLIRAQSREREEGFSQEEIENIQHQVNRALNAEDITPANDVLAVTKFIIRKLWKISTEATVASARTETDTDDQQPSGLGVVEPSQEPAQRKPAKASGAIKFKDRTGAHAIPIENVLKFEDFMTFVRENFLREDLRPTFDKISYEHSMIGIGCRPLSDRSDLEIIGPMSFIDPKY